MAHGTEGHGVPPKSPSGSGSPCPQASGSLPHHRLCSSPNFPPMKGPVTSGDLTGLRWNMAAPERSSLSVLECCSHTRFTRTKCLSGHRDLMRPTKLQPIKNKAIQTSCEQNIQFFPTLAKKEHRGRKLNAAAAMGTGGERSQLSSALSLGNDKLGEVLGSLSLGLTLFSGPRFIT